VVFSTDATLQPLRTGPGRPVWRLHCHSGMAGAFFLVTAPVSCVESK
jgi:hypothetical protein